MRENKKEKKVLIVGIIFLIIVLVGSTYAFFAFSKIQRAFSLTTNGVTATFTAGNNEVSMGGAYPISDSYAINNLANLDCVDFTVSGSGNDSKNEYVTYEIYLTEKSGNTLDSNYVKVYLTDDDDNYVAGPFKYNSLDNTLYSKDAETGKLVLSNSEINNFSDDYKLYVWVDEEYSQNDVSQTFSFYINVYAYNNNAYTITFNPSGGSVNPTTKQIW